MKSELVWKCCFHTKFWLPERLNFLTFGSLLWWPEKVSFLSCMVIAYDQWAASCLSNGQSTILGDWKMKFPQPKISLQVLPMAWPWRGPSELLTDIILCSFVQTISPDEHPRKKGTLRSWYHVHIKTLSISIFCCYWTFVKIDNAYSRPDWKI